MLSRLAMCGNKKTDSHTCRNLHRWLHRSGQLLPVAVSTVCTPVRVSRRNKNQIEVAYPVLRPSSWLRCSCELGGHAFLAGHSLDSMDEVSNLLRLFWSRYKLQDPNLRFFQDFPSGDEWGHSLPVAIHGDEGRGKGRNPVLVTAVQTVLPSCGQSVLDGYLGKTGVHVCYSLIYTHGQICFAHVSGTPSPTGSFTLSWPHLIQSLLWISFWKTWWMT